MDGIQTRLDLPARKVMIESLHKAESTTNTTAIPDLCMWKIHSDEIFSIIWIQGTVTEVFDDEKGFLLNDGTAVVEIVDCSGVPSGCPKPEQDKYMMVVGELLSIHTGPAIKAMKIQDLSTDTQAQMLWPMEVKDSDRFLARYPQ